jgi:hypothetical protein
MLAPLSGPSATPKSGTVRCVPWHHAVEHYFKERGGGQPTNRFKNSIHFIHRPLFKTQIFYVLERGPHQIAGAKWWGDEHQGHCHLRRI